ncbi:metallophosphoesterase family protein [Lacticaseibacillus absianus]|uniref:metallophosphoesterase family protein n=1 Tax=Lacticaseibacillus absianus TaxID=2729623 RepID=UPI0015C76218|nr:metallophosphoesterase family protein [Lacticaseibacillus absianus]
MTKIAVMADVHGNVTALAAALADAQAQGATQIWLLGDLLMPGPGGAELFELIAAYGVRLLVRGNWEDILFKGLAQGYTDNFKHRYFTRLARFIGAQLTPAQLATLRALPLTATRSLAGLQVSVSHNQPAQNWGPALMPAAEQAHFDALVPPTADLALYAHTHHQLLRYTSHEQPIINPGSVGMPVANWPRHPYDHRARYALMTLANEHLGDLAFRRVDYDVATEAHRATEAGLPYLELYLDQLQTGTIHTYDEAALTRLNAQYDATDPLA